MNSRTLDAWLLRRAPLCLGLTITLMLCLPGGARALDDRMLSYRAPPECPDRAELERGVEALLSGAEPIDARVRVGVAITRRDDGALELRVRWTGGDNPGQRQLEAESCRAALDTAAWLIALALKSSDPKLTAAEPARSPSLRYELGAGALLDSAPLPKVGLGFAARAGLATGAWRIVLSGAYLLPQDHTLGSARGTIRVIEIAVTGCHLWDIYPVAVGPCLRAAMGSMSASSLSVPEPTTGSGRSQSLGAGAEARLRFTDSLMLFSDISLIWNQRRPRVVLLGTGTLFEPRSGGLRIDLGILWSPP